MKYVVKKRNKILQVIEIDYPIKGYKFKPKSDVIKSINVVQDKLINSILIAKINEMFTRLLMIVNDAFNSDDNPTGTAIALDEISMVRSTLSNKYHKYLSEEKESLYLKKLDLIEEEMKVKLYQYQNVYKEEKGRGR